LETTGRGVAGLDGPLCECAWLGERLGVTATLGDWAEDASGSRELFDPPHPVTTTRAAATTAEPTA
jgi:hypothetical protein